MKGYIAVLFLLLVVCVSCTESNIKTIDVPKPIQPFVNSKVVVQFNFLSAAIFNITAYIDKENQMFQYQLCRDRHGVVECSSLLSDYKAKKNTYFTLQNYTNAEQNVYCVLTDIIGPSYFETDFFAFSKFDSVKIKNNQLVNKWTSFGGVDSNVIAYSNVYSNELVYFETEEENPEYVSTMNVVSVEYGKQDSKYFTVPASVVPYCTASSAHSKEFKSFPSKPMELFKFMTFLMKELN